MPRTTTVTTAHQNSDSDDLGGFEATPHRPEHTSRLNGKAASSRGAAAAPRVKPEKSSAVANGATQISKAKRGAREVVVHGVTDNDDDETTVPAASRQRGDTNPPKRARTDAKVPTANGKGKSKAVVAQRRVRPAEPNDEIVEANVVEDAASTGEEEDPAPIRPVKSNGPSRRPRVPTVPKNGGMTENHWEALVADMEKQRDELAVQFEKLSKLRLAEAEQALEEYRIAAESRAKSQDDLIQSLTAQISRIDELTKEGHSASLHFLTRESSDAKHASAIAKMRRKDEENAQLRATITQLQEQNRILESDLQAEIEHARNQKKSVDPSPARRISRLPDTPPRSKGGETKNAKIIAFYEDLTNFLITNIKIESDGRGGEATTYNCIQTVNNRSLNFTLKRGLVLDDDAEPGQAPVDKVIYHPLALDKEHDDNFIESLDFLASDFVFDSNQLSTFLSTVTERMRQATEEVQSADEIADDS